MILSCQKILKAIQKKELVIEPFREENLSACSYDLTLSNEIIIFNNNGTIDVKNPKFSINKLQFSDEGIHLYPLRFYLASTVEFIELPENISAFIEGKSSIGRLGLFIHNAGWIDPGFKGQITLELFNASSNIIKLYPNMKICQIIFSYLDEKTERPYKGKYYNQKGVTLSKIDLDFK